MIDTIQTLLLSLLLTLLIIYGIGSAFPALYNAWINRGFEQEKRLAALKTKIKRLFREKAANAGSQKLEDLADELDELAQLSWAVKRKKNNREVTSVDLLEAADMLRQASRSAAQGTEDHVQPRELIEKLRIRLSPQEEQRFPRISGLRSSR